MSSWVYAHTFAQDILAGDIRFEVRKIYPPLSITQQQAEKVHRLADLNNEANALDLFFKPSWIRSYVSVEVIAKQHNMQLMAI